jgi:hypothetical protein
MKRIVVSLSPRRTTLRPIDRPLDLFRDRRKLPDLLAVRPSLR